MRAASSVAASLAIATLALLAVGPVIGANAAADPTVEPCEPQACDVVTVTITETPTGKNSPTPTGDPVVTATVTVTPTPTSAPAPTSDSATTTQQPQSFPTSEAVVPPPGQDTPTPEPAVTLAPATPAVPSEPTTAASFDEPAPNAVGIEIRNATPEFDGTTLSHKLAVPAALLLLLVLLAWLIFEGRLRRMAHAAAVRKAGPRAGKTPGGPDEFAGYPAGPGYAPMVGFVPVQTYTMGYPQQPYGYPQVPYGYPQAYGQQGYGQQAYDQHGYPIMDQGYPVTQAGVPQAPVADAQPVDPWGAAVSEPAPGVWSEATGTTVEPAQPHGDDARPDSTAQFPVPGDPSSADR